MSYCPNCGKELSEGSKFCQNCGKATDGNQANNQQPVNNQPQYQPPYQQQYQQAYQPPYQQQTYQPPYQQYYAPQKNIVQLLSGKVRIQAIIWLIIACVQYIFGIANIAKNIDLILDEEIYGFVMGICLIAVAIINTIFSTQNFKYSTEVLKNPIGIISKYTPVGSIIATLVYNLLFGGVIGVAGSIYAFVIRSFVINNEVEFAKIEKQRLTQMHAANN